MGLTLSAAAAAATFIQLIPRTLSYIPAGPFVEVEDCLGAQCPDINRHSLYPRVAQAFEEFSSHNATFFERYWRGVKLNPEYLRFDQNDLRAKGLVISAAFEQNGALNPKFIAPLVNELSKTLDVKFVVARSVKDICKYIEEAKNLGKKTDPSILKRVIIFAQGNPSKLPLQNRELKPAH